MDDLGTMDDAAHRSVAVATFNRTWDLLDAGDERTGDEDLELLLAAATSRWHWGVVGDEDTRATGDWQVSHVLARLGAGDLSLRFATRCLAGVERSGATGWRLASAHEGVARAHAARGDAEAATRHVAAARTALADESDEEDRAVIEEQLADIDPA